MTGSVVEAILTSHLAELENHNYKQRVIS